VAVTCPLHLSGWLAARSVRLFLDKSHRYIFLSMLAKDPSLVSEDICLEAMNSAKRKALQNEQEEREGTAETTVDLDKGTERDSFHGDDEPKGEHGKEDSEMDVDRDGDNSAGIMGQDIRMAEEEHKNDVMVTEGGDIGTERDGAGYSSLEMATNSKCVARTKL